MAQQLLTLQAVPGGLEIYKHPELHACILHDWVRGRLQEALLQHQVAVPFPPSGGKDVHSVQGGKVHLVGDCARSSHLEKHNQQHGHQTYQTDHVYNTFNTCII